MRAPVGGLFRHVRDLATMQEQMGHAVGIVCDSTTGGPEADKALERLAHVCTLGITRTPMSRMVAPRDFWAYRATRKAAEEGGVDILHGHGAKGGAYARLVAQSLKEHGYDVRSFYTPHGGSLHYDPRTLAGLLFLRLEHILAPMTDGMIFESAYSRRVYEDKIGYPPCDVRVIANGLLPNEFYELHLDSDPVDFLFVGELRQLKGVDVYIKALSRLNRWKRFKALVVGAGPDAEKFRRRARKLTRQHVLRFTGPMPARQAFARSRCLVVPSRAESLPYIVLEAAAVQMPMILTDVGGIPEIAAGSGIRLIEPGNTRALHDQMVAFLEDPLPFVEHAKVLQKNVSVRYSVVGMTRSIIDFYRTSRR